MNNMVEQITFQTIFQFLQTLSIMVGIAYYLMILQNQQKSQQTALETRQAQLFMPIYAKFYDKEFMKDYVKIISWEWTDYDDFMKKYGANNIEAWSTIMAWTDYFEGLGVLVKRGLIEVSFIDDLISGMVIQFWEKYGPYIMEFRERANYPQFAEFCEYLYVEIKSIAEQQHPELETGIISKFQELVTQ